jgi:hypothetical protein
MAVHGASHAVDGVAFEAGGGQKVQIARVALQWDWQKKWWQSNGTHIGGYWDVNLSQWRGNQYRNVPGARQNITSIGITPVFRFQNDSLKGFYGEAGIGANLLSELYNNDGHQLSTAFEFGDHIGVGYVFNNGMDLGLKLQHFSNGSIKQPNGGVNFAILRLGYKF